MKKYFQSKGDTCFVTDNSWKEYRKSEISKIQFSEYSKEMNQDILIRVRFEQELNINESNLFFSELRKIRRLLSAKFPKEKYTHNGFGDEFEVFATSVLFDLPYKYVMDNCVCFGSKDGKIDSFYVDEEKKCITLCQIKLGDNIEANIKDIILNTYADYIRGSKEDYFKDFKKKIIDHYSPKFLYDYSVRIIVIKANPMAGVDFILVKDIIKDFIRKSLLPKEKMGVKLHIKKEKNENVLMTSNDGKMSFFFCSAISLIDSIKESLGDDFHDIFYNNVRGELKNNTAIENTIKLEPFNFKLYNNGISFTCSTSRENQNCIVVMNPSIVNGQQTVITLNKAFTKGAVNDVIVPVFLKNESEISIVRKIAKSNNYQSVVKPLDLLSLIPELRVLQKNLLELNPKIFLDIYSTGKIPNRDKIIKYIQPQRIKIKDFTRLYFSLLEPTKIGLWKNSFSKSLLTSDFEEHNFNFELSKDVCNVIIEFSRYQETFIDNPTLLSETNAYDLTFQIAYFKYRSIEKAKSFVDEIIEKNKVSGKTVLDIFRSRDIHKKMLLVDNDIFKN
jgi:hypothetical protein